jgi:hypothetical protein
VELVITSASSPNAIKSDFSLLDEVLREFACQNGLVSTIEINEGMVQQSSA